KRQSAAAASKGDDPRARAIGFLMSLYQRRLSSSTFALRRSLENRAHRLSEGLRKAQDLARVPLPEVPGADEIEEMEEADRDRLERQLEAIALTENADQVREEIQELHALAAQAKTVEDADAEAKLSRLRDLLESEGFFA